MFVGLTSPFVTFGTWNHSLPEVLVLKDNYHIWRTPGIDNVIYIRLGSNLNLEQLMHKSNRKPD